jgi:isopenicillin-N N-acyltransferase-like protein
MLKRLLKITGWVIGILVLSIMLLSWYIVQVSVIDPPTPSSQYPTFEKIVHQDSLVTFGNNWFRKSESGLYEVYVEGDAYTRGVALGVLTKDLVRHQEDVFTQQLYHFVPSSFYRKILIHLIGYFNRNLHDVIPQEYKEEIYGVSQSASSDYNMIAMPYQRMLNYHGAHDIGHALQNMSLVGCTSFALWGSKTQDSTLLIGRNFDFYVGDEFSRDKIVAFYKPTNGYPFMMITFGGMTGVLSGMNMEGITVTINAAKSEIPTESATPVSLVAREILQYARTIEEAYRIAADRNVFVSETFMIGSAHDKHAAIIEKSPFQQDLVSSTSLDNQLICTNHFQSELLGNTNLNNEHMKNSASVYRYERVNELLNRKETFSPSDVVEVLRNQHGLADATIGLGNEKSINQLVAHHSIVFQPEKKRVWVSTAPWQLGKFVCYDLNEVFGEKKETNNEIYVKEFEIPVDSFQYTQEYTNFLKFSPFRFVYIPTVAVLQPDSVVAWNPASYLSYKLAGDYYYGIRNYEKALQLYEKGLACEVATQQEREVMEKQKRLCESNIILQ